MHPFTFNMHFLRDMFNECIAIFKMFCHLCCSLLLFKALYCPAVHCLAGYHGYSHVTPPLFSQHMYHGSKENDSVVL